MKVTLYYAVNGHGQGRVFISPPVRNDKFKIWEGYSLGVYSHLVMQLESEGFELPNIKFSDEPVELELEISVKKP